jgi:DNA-directed RNA polymerase specialized sigma24 family protein
MTETDREQTDEQLWQDHVDGVPGALAALHERHGAELCWYLLLSTGSTPEATRCVMRTWDCLARWPHPFEGFASVREWLYAVATQTNVPPAVALPCGEDISREDFGWAARADRWRDVFDRVQNVPRHQRQPLLLAHTAGFAPDALGRICRLSDSEATQRAAAGLRRLARAAVFRKNIPIESAAGELAQMEPLTMPDEFLTHVRDGIAQRLADSSPLRDSPALADPMPRRRWARIFVPAAVLIMVVLVPLAWQATQKMLAAQWQDIANAAEAAPKNAPSPQNGLHERR